MVQCDSQSQASHFLLELVEDAEITINAIILGYQLQQRHSHKSKDDVITLIDDFFIVNCVLRAFFFIQESCIKISSSDSSAALSQLLQFLLVRFDDVMSNFKDCPFVLEIFKDFGVHLQVHFENFAKDWIQAIKKHTCLILSKICSCFLILEFLDDLLIFFKDGAADYQVEAVHQNMLQNTPSIEMLVMLGVVNH